MVVEKAKVHTIKTWKQALPVEGVVQAYGHRRKGKTATPWKIAEDLHKAGRTVATVVPDKGIAAKVFPRWVKLLSSIDEMKDYKRLVVLVDEMALWANARDHNKSENKDWIKLMAIVAQYHHLMILICQHTRQLDPQLAMDYDLLIFKRPSLLHISFARPELRGFVQEAYDAFADLGKRDPRGYTYVIDPHNGRRGFLKNTKPTFWTERISTLYAEMIANEAPKRERPQKPKGETPGAALKEILGE